MPGETPSRIGKYDIRGKIGQGAMGEVFRGHDPVLNRDVAIKTMSGGHSDPALLQRFQREAQSAARLNHSNIITVYDFGEEHGRLYMAMELLEGTDLKDAIGSLSFDEKLNLMEQICDGLAFAHAKHVVHRDLKPANIHIQPNGQVKILDFGLARLGASEMTATGTVMGTPNYMSPEQVRGEKADARSDVFSIGSVFYELLTDRKPFEAESMHAVLFQVLQSEPTPVRQWAPTVPPILAELVERCLAKDAARRFADGGRLREALEAVRRALDEGRADSARLADELPGDAEATVVDAPKTARPRRGPGSSVRLIDGATVLDDRPSPADDEAQTIGAGDARATVVADPTVRGDASGATAVLRPARTSTAYVAGGVALAIAAATGAYVFFKPAPPATTPSPAASAGHIGANLIAAGVARAQVRLDAQDWRGAMAEAGAVLQLEPGNHEALRIRDAALAGEAAAATPRPSPPDVEPTHRGPSVRPSAAPTPAVSAVPTPAAAPSVSPTPMVVPTPVASATALIIPATPPPTAPPPNEEPAIRRVIAEFGEAIERKDLGLYKRLRPNLSAEDERRLRAAFDRGQSQQVSLSVASIEVSGTEAHVSLTRRDTFKGQSLPPVQQTWVLVKGPAGWTIREIRQ